MALEFISIIDPTGHLNGETNYFTKLLDLPITSEQSGRLFHYVRNNPSIIHELIKGRPIFDYFYEKAISDKTPAGTHWADYVVKIVEHMGPTGNAIRCNRSYILRLQGTHRTHSRLFRLLLEHNFDMGDEEFLVYSIVARGELSKLRSLASLYIIEEYPALFDVALRYGRADIIKYFIQELGLDINSYGKVPDFANYTDDYKYIYYRDRLPPDSLAVQHSPRISGATQDYTAALELVLQHYKGDITICTLDRWCELFRTKIYDWDTFDAGVLLNLLKARLTDPVPLTHDFGVYNRYIFGSEWSDRAPLIEYCLSLESRYNDLLERYNLLAGRLQYSNLREN